MRQIPIVRAASGRRSKPRDTHLWSALLPRNTALAVAIVIEIAIHSDGHPLNAKVLSKRYRLPPRHFEPLLQVLAHNGILHSARGVHGGYELARKPARITLEQIFIAAAADKSKAQPRLSASWVGQYEGVLESSAIAPSGAESGQCQRPDATRAYRAIVRRERPYGRSTATLLFRQESVGIERIGWD